MKNFSLAGGKDEVFGIYGWQRSHMMIGNSLYCTVSIWDPEKKTWISKQDVGTTGDFEKEKKCCFGFVQKSMRESGNWKGAVYGSLYLYPD